MIRSIPARLFAARPLCVLAAQSRCTFTSRALLTQAYKHNLQQRLQSTTASNGLSDSNTTASNESDSPASLESAEASTPLEAVSAEDSSIPWYMRANEDTEQLSPNLKEPIPELPQDSPDSMQPLVEHMVRDLGLTDIEFIDLRDHNPPSVFGPDAIMIVATGKSDKHIGKAAQGLVSFVKQTFGTVPYQEGVVTAGYIKVQKRRQLKKSKRLSAFRESRDSLQGRFSSDWISLETKTNDILIHIFTSDKRQEIDLEQVWSTDRRELREQRKQQQELSGQEGDNLHQSIYETSSASKSQKSSPSPFSSFGSVRNFHTALASFAAPPPPTSQSFNSIISELVSSNKDRSPANSPKQSSEFSSTNKEKDINDIFQELKLFSFLGNYKKAREIYTSTFAKHEFNSQVTLNKLPPPATETEKQAQKLSSEALILLLKAHINYTSRIKSTSHPELSTLKLKTKTLELDNTQLSDSSIPKHQTTLKQNSDVVNSFTGCFPYFPTSDHWRLRLLFFQRAHMINPAEFPLRMLVQIPILQLSSGEFPSRWSIDFILSTIIRSHQFDSKNFMVASNLKSQLALSLLFSCVRPLSPTGKSTLDNTMLMFFYRLWINEQNNLRKHTITASQATSNPTPILTPEGTLYNVSLQVKEDPRSRVMTPQAKTLFQYFASELNVLNYPANTVSHEDPKLVTSFLILSFTSFVNDGLWSNFWSLWRKTITSPLFTPEMFYTLSALVSKSGNRKSMARLLDHEIPTVFMFSDDYITPDILKLINTVLSVIDPAETGYRQFRKMLDTK